MNRRPTVEWNEREAVMPRSPNQYGGFAIDAPRILPLVKICSFFAEFAPPRRPSRQRRRPARLQPPDRDNRVSGEAVVRHSTRLIRSRLMFFSDSTQRSSIIATPSSSRAADVTRREAAMPFFIRRRPYRTISSPATNDDHAPECRYAYFATRCASPMRRRYFSALP